jgi:hypothetical protein
MAFRNLQLTKRNNPLQVACAKTSSSRQNNIFRSLVTELLMDTVDDVMGRLLWYLMYTFLECWVDLIFP